MKKIMITAAILLSAVCTQAAALKWGCTNVRIPVAADVKVSESGIVTTSTDTKFKVGELSISLFYVDSEGADKFITTVGLTGEGAKAASSGSFNVETVTGWDIADAQNAVFKIAATYETKDGVYNYSGTASQDIRAVLANTSDKTVTFNMSNGTIGSWNYTANAVPEPTSGLLLLLGVAGLALRRRRA